MYHAASGGVNELLLLRDVRARSAPVHGAA